MELDLEVLLPFVKGGLWYDHNMVVGRIGLCRNKGRQREMFQTLVMNTAHKRQEARAST